VNADPRALRILGYCRACPRATDIEVAAHFGLTVDVVRADRTAMGCLRRTTTGERGIGAAQQRILDELAAAGHSLRVATLARRVGVDAQNAYKSLRRLAVRGLARCVSETDGQRWALGASEMAAK
jgi:hypothetical protein